MQTNNFSKLPKSWQIKTLGEVCVSTNSNITFKNIQDKKGDYPIYGASGVVAYVDFYTKENQSLGIVKDGSVGKIFLLPPKSSVLSTLHYVETNDDLNLKYLFYFLQSINLARYITGSVIPHIYFRDWKKEQIPLPPLEIQKRIVARLESAFEKIEKGSAHLQDAKTKLTKYKQSLLKSAFNGTLTATASLQGVEKAETIHKVDCHDLTSSKLAMTDKENPKLPQGWTIKTLGEIAQIKGGKRLPKDAKYAETITPYPYIRVTDFENMSVNMTNLKYLTKEVQQKIKNYTISKDDIYISIAGSIGKVGIIPDKLHNANLTENAAKIVHSMDKKYLAFYLNSSEVQSQIAFFTKATTQPKLALYRIENLKIKIPPLETQKQIVKLLEKHLQHADKTGEFIESALNKAKQLKQSLLKSAFLGKLT